MILDNGYYGKNPLEIFNSKSFRRIQQIKMDLANTRKALEKKVLKSYIVHQKHIRIFLN